jgi:hypothetical protein
MIGSETINENARREEGDFERKRGREELQSG